MACLLQWEDLVQTACQGSLQFGASLLIRETDIKLRSSSMKVAFSILCQYQTTTPVDNSQQTEKSFKVGDLLDCN